MQKMMINLIATIIVVMLWCNVVNARDAASDSIYWSRNYKLKWSDFQGVVPSEVTWKAVSYAAIDAWGYMDGGLPNYKVFNVFLRDQSWTMDTVSRDLLEHEQLHFDIAELYARKIKKAIESCRQKKLKNNSSYERLILRLMHERRAIDVKYDNETSHSMNMRKQKEWRKNISKELDELRRYISDNAGLVYGQERDSMSWSKAFKLKWSDFQCEPDTALEWKAVSSITISTRGFNEGDLPNFHVTNLFVRSKSWSKNKNSQSLLEHEQLHFDIAEVYARKIIKSIHLLRQKKIKGYERYSVVIQELAAERDKVDKRYDEECYYGTFLSSQEKWRARITKELDALKQYESGK